MMTSTREFASIIVTLYKEGYSKESLKLINQIPSFLRKKKQYKRPRSTKDPLVRNMTTTMLLDEEEVPNSRAPDGFGQEVPERIPQDGTYFSPRKQMPH
jgi:hypothetical protein